MEKKNSAAVLLAVIILIMTGCSAVLTSQKADVYQQVGPPNTVGYFLPKGLLRVKLVPSQQGTNYDLTVESIYVPDPDCFYTLTYHPNAAYDDFIKVTLSDNGFISTIEVTTEDKSSVIVEKVIGIVKDVIKSVTLPVPAAEVKEALPKKTINITFDPNKDEEINDIIKMLKKDFEITLKIKREGGTATYQKALLPEGNSIYYRPLVPYRITLESKDFMKTETFYLPNGAPILALDINRAPFVKKNTKLGFSNGILASVEITKPSEIVGGLEIPAKIAKAILEIPGELIQLKIDTTKKYKELYQEQLNTIKAKDEMINYLLQRQPGQQPGQQTGQQGPNPFSTPAGQKGMGIGGTGGIKSQIDKPGQGEAPSTGK